MLVVQKGEEWSDEKLMHVVDILWQVADAIGGVSEDRSTVAYAAFGFALGLYHSDPELIARLSRALEVGGAKYAAEKRQLSIAQSDQLAARLRAWLEEPDES